MYIELHLMFIIIIKRKCDSIVIKRRKYKKSVVITLLLSLTHYNYNLEHITIYRITGFQDTRSFLQCFRRKPSSYEWIHGLVVTFRSFSTYPDRMPNVNMYIHINIIIRVTAIYTLVSVQRFRTFYL